MSRCHDERLRVRHEADLANRAHPIDRSQVIEHGEGLHRQGQADAGFQPILERGHAAALPADDPVVVAVQESDQPQARRFGVRQDLGAANLTVRRPCCLAHRGGHQAVEAAARRAWFRPST